MSIEGQGYFFTIYFPGFVCFVLYYAKISGERLQDHWSSGFMLFSAIVSIESLTNACITITHVYVCALTLAVSLRSSLNPRPGGLGYKQVPRATANVNA